VLQDPTQQQQQQQRQLAAAVTWQLEQQRTALEGTPGARNMCSTSMLLKHMLR
jgi:hypothetical protein